EFHQVDMSLRREREGAGLGLAISKRFVELHGGHMWVHSEMGVGSVFSFSLPLSSEARPVQLAQTRALEPRRAYELSVVLLEPDVGTRELLSRYLKNYQVLQARDEQEAAALIAQWHPQALLVNQPPGEEWSEGTWERALRIAPAQMAVISCSIPSQRWLSGLVPVEGCLTKPFSRQELLDHVRDLQGIQDVLVVDDDRGFVQLVARYLESMNGAYRVRWAYEGQEALAQIRQEAPDLILLDLIMPVMDGLQFLEAMRSDPSLADIPVIIVTATDYAERIAERHPGLVAIGRRKAFRPMETIRTVAAVLGSIQVEAFDSTMPVPEAAASG
ncbi:MAG: response regulator, partial [Chloroflexi bacterium]|nr:response regulator [Chloroflexota bacterium]